MSDFNHAIRMAQRLLRSRANTFGQVEVGYNQWTESPKRGIYLLAADELEPLICPVVSTSKEQANENANREGQ